eukprot:4149316-Alexandrium_andersonii.AAC.1
MPTLILGDLNALPEKVPCLQQLLQEGSWHDVGAKASVWDPAAVDEAPTAKAHNAREPTRIDYCFVNASA